MPSCLPKSMSIWSGAAVAIAAGVGIRGHPYPCAGDAPRRQRLVPLAPRISDAEREAHRAFIATLGDKAIWNEFLPAPVAAPAG